MNRKILFAFALLTAAISAQASAFDPVTLVWKPKAASVMKYTQKGTIYNAPIPGMTGDLKFTATVTNTVKEIQSGGNILVEAKQENFTMSVGGQDMGGGPPNVVEVLTEKPNGFIIARKADDNAKGGDSPRLDQLQQFTFPDKPVNVGDTWNLEQKGESASDTYDSVTEFTFRGADSVNGIAGYKVEFTYKETNAPTATTATGTVWVSQDTCDLLKIVAKIKNAQLGAQLPQPVDMDFSMEKI